MSFPKSSVMMGVQLRADSVRYALAKKPKAARSEREKNYYAYMANMDGYISMSERVKYADISALLQDLVALGFSSAIEAIEELPEINGG